MATYVDDINVIYLTGGGYIRERFDGLGKDTIGFNETVWASNLTRSKDFSLRNIDDVDMGQVPQCHISIPYMTIEKFKVLQAILRERHVIADYFDVDLGKRVIHEMAITQNERKKLLSQEYYVTGVTDLKIKLVGTNRDDEQLEKCLVSYDSNGGSGSIAPKEYQKTAQVRISNGTGLLKSGYHLESWNTRPDGSGSSYLPNTTTTIMDDLTLYAQWRQ